MICCSFNTSSSPPPSPSIPIFIVLAINIYLSFFTVIEKHKKSWSCPTTAVESFRAAANSCTASKILRSWTTTLLCNSIFRGGHTELQYATQLLGVHWVLDQICRREILVPRSAWLRYLCNFGRWIMSRFARWSSGQWWLGSQPKRYQIFGCNSICVGKLRTIVHRFTQISAACQTIHYLATFQKRNVTHGAKQIMAKPSNSYSRNLHWVGDVWEPKKIRWELHVHLWPWPTIIMTCVIRNNVCALRKNVTIPGNFRHIYEWKILF